MDQLDIRYQELREQLYTLGFHQQLPIGSLGIVSALLEDLIKVTDSYKTSKQTVKTLLEEKKAWNLGIEPYKCDNSRLLSENNGLHLEAIRVRDQHNKQLLELKRTIRNLEVDKSYLEDHCYELVSKIREMDGVKQGSKYNDGGKVLIHKKAFISTVRCGNFVPHPNPQKQLASRRSDGKYSDESHIEIVKLQNDIHALKDETDMLKKQLSGRDREITRLHNELTGGRPAAALGRDCCYRGIDSLAEDMKLLQKQLIATKNELKDSLEQQHEAKLRAIKLDEEKTKLARELREMEEVALKVQDEANAKLMAKEKQLGNIEGKLNESMRRIAFLEADGNKIVSSSSHQSKDIKNMKATLKKMNDENENLLRNIKALMDNEVKLEEKIKELSEKNCKLEEKVKTQQSLDQPKKLQKHLLSKSTSTEPETKSVFSKEKLFYQTEYLRRLNQPAYERELENVQSQLSQRENEIHELKEKLAAQPPPVTKPSYCHSSISVQSVMNRMEREANLSKLEIERLTAEKDDLQQKFQKIKDVYQNDQLEHARISAELSNAIKDLKMKNRNLQNKLDVVAPNQTKILTLTEEKERLLQKIDEQSSELDSLTSSYNQLKLLHEQTEKSLLDHQNRLYQAENQLGQAESQLSAKDSKYEFTNRTVGNLKAEISKLTKIIETIDRDKNEMMLQLDSKTEQIFQMETDIKKLKLDNAELTSNAVESRRQISNKGHETVEKSNTIAKLSKQTESLRIEVEHLQTLKENLSSENSRLNHEIIDLTCACNDMKKRLVTSEQEVDCLKNQIKDYVKKVQQADDLLMRKEEERDDMLEHYNTLSKDTVKLEDTIHSLECEATDAKRCLAEAEEQLNYLKEIITARDNEIVDCDQQTAELSKQVTTLECKLEQYHEKCGTLQAEVNATKELCNKLDIEKIKLNEELKECSDIRRKLERENKKLREDLKSASRVNEDHGAIEGLKELLNSKGEELEQLRVTISEKEIELKHLRRKIKELEAINEEERQNSDCHKKSAQEYSVQIQELRHQLTNARFAAPVSKDKLDQYGYSSLSVARDQSDERDRNKISNENRNEILNSQASNSNQSVNSMGTKTGPFRNLRAGTKRIYRRSNAPPSEIKTLLAKRLSNAINEDSSDESRPNTETTFSKSASSILKKSPLPLQSEKKDKHSIDSVMMPNSIQNQNLYSRRFSSSENREGLSTTPSSHSECFERLNQKMAKLRKKELDYVTQNKASLKSVSETPIDECVDVSDDARGSFQMSDGIDLSQVSVESSLPCIQQSIDNRQDEISSSQLPRKSFSINRTLASISCESIEEYHTCRTNTSKLRNNHKTVNRSEDSKSQKKQTNYDTSFLPPPPQVHDTFTTKTTKYTVNIISHIGSIDNITGNYAVSKIK